MKKFVIFLFFIVFLCGCSNTYKAGAGAEIENLNNKKFEWGLKKNKNAPPDINPGAGEILSEYGAYYMGDANSKDIFLTFDEGYENGYTAKILDVLKTHQVPACFFVTGPYLENEPELIKRMLDEGHEVGNHTVNHPSMPSVKTTNELENEMLDLDRKFFSLTGKTMHFMRPPKGEYSEKSLAIAKSLGYKTVLWSLAYEDWDVNRQKGSQYVYNSVMDNIHGGAIILMHAVSKDNAETLDQIITDIKSKGYVFRSLHELPKLE